MRAGCLSSRKRQGYIPPIPTVLIYHSPDPFSLLLFLPLLYLLIQPKNSNSNNRIFGTPPTLDEFLEPKEELEANNQDSELLDLAGDVRVLEDGDKVIVAKVVLELAEKDGKVIDIESDSDDESGAPDISRGEAANLCEQLMEACLQHGGANSDLAIGLLTHLRHFRVHLRQDELLHSRQTTLNHYFASQSPERTM